MFCRILPTEAPFIIICLFHFTIIQCIRSLLVVAKKTRSTSLFLFTSYFLKIKGTSKQMTSLWGDRGWAGPPWPPRGWKDNHQSTRARVKHGWLMVAVGNELENQVCEAENKGSSCLVRKWVVKGKNVLFWFPFYFSFLFATVITLHRKLKVKWFVS